MLLKFHRIHYYCLEALALPPLPAVIFFFNDTGKVGRTADTVKSEHQNPLKGI